MELIARLITQWPPIIQCSLLIKIIVKDGRERQVKVLELNSRVNIIILSVEVVLKQKQLKADCKQLKCKTAWVKKTQPWMSNWQIFLSARFQATKAWLMPASAPWQRTKVVTSTEGRTIVNQTIIEKGQKTKNKGISVNIQRHLSDKNRNLLMPMIWFINQGRNYKNNKTTSNKVKCLIII